MPRDARMWPLLHLYNLWKSLTIIRPDYYYYGTNQYNKIKNNHDKLFKPNLILQVTLVTNYKQWKQEQQGKLTNAMLKNERILL